MIERTYGRSRRENAGISSESMVRIHAIESLRFPGEGSSAQGKSGPKVRPKGVADGQQVYIPALRYNRTVGTRTRNATGDGRTGASRGPVRQAKPPCNGRL